MSDFSWSGIGQTLKSGMLGDVNYDPETMKLEQQKANEERDLAMKSRGDQAALGQALRNQMAGKGPSVAQNQMQTGREQMMRAATSASAGARGSGVAAANKQGMTTAQNIGAGVNRDAATLRAQEVQAATKMAVDQAYQQRMQDLMSRGMSIDEAKAQLDYYAKLQSTRMQGAIAEQQGAQAGVAGMMGMAAGALALGGSGMEIKTNVETMGASPQPIDEGFRPGPARTNFISATRSPGPAPAPVPGQNMDTRLAQPDRVTNSGGPPSKTMGALAGALAGYSSGLSGKSDAYKNTMETLRQQQAEWDAKNPKTGMSQFDQDVMNSGMETKSNVQQMGGSPSPNPEADMAKMQASQSSGSDWQAPQAPERASGLASIPVVGGMLKGIGSDERAKKAVALGSALSKSKEQRFPVTEELSKLPTIRYNYENNELGNFKDMYGPQKFTGTSANVMEKLPSTAPAVKRGPNGVRMVDPTIATMTTLGATAELSRRVQELEAQKEADNEALKRLVDSKPGTALKSSLKKKAVGSSALQPAVYEEGFKPSEPGPMRRGAAVAADTLAERPWKERPGSVQKELAWITRGMPKQLKPLSPEEREAVDLEAATRYEQAIADAATNIGQGVDVQKSYAALRMALQQRDQLRRDMAMRKQYAGGGEMAPTPSDLAAMPSESIVADELKWRKVKPPKNPPRRDEVDL